jgi:hypothetical protein
MTNQSDSRPTVFVDLDETLAVILLLQALKQKAKEGWGKYSFIPPAGSAAESVPFAALVRPSARAFLAALKEHYDVSVMTSGNSIFQSFVLEQLGLRDLIDGVWGGDNVCEMVLPDRWVLVDNLEPYLPASQRKLEGMTRSTKIAMGEELWQELLARHYIQCAGWSGRQDDEPLTGLMAIVHDKLLRPLV